MKKYKRSLQAFLLMLILPFAAWAQVPASYLCTIKNDSLLTSKIYEFDIYLQKTDPAIVFELATFQAAIVLNPAILNGGTITASLVGGSSEFAAAQQPNSLTFTAGQNCIKLAPRLGPGHGAGTIISATSPGTRVIRIRLTNTADFGQFSPNFVFSFTVPPYRSIVSVYDQTTFLNTNITNPVNHTVAAMANPILNAPVAVFNMTSGGNYCLGGSGTDVGLSGSQAGVEYKLVKNAIPVGANVPGTGAALSFGLQTIGTYTSTAFRQGTYITGTMTGSVTVSEITVTPTLSGLNPVCALTPGTVYSTEPDKTNYFWIVSPGGTVTAGGSSTSNTVTVTWNTPGIQTVSVNYTDLGCTAAAPAVYDVTVIPATVGGSITGSGAVCAGNNSTLLTLSGHTGSVQMWQSSTDGSSWTDIPNIETTYTANNLVENTYFRALVKNEECLVEESSPAYITMFLDYHISGYAKYSNNPGTPLSGLKITLKQGNTTIGTPFITGPSGFYEFTGLVNGTYDLTITTAHLSGQWQTWSGVNNTDYLLVSRHALGVSLLPVNPPVVRVSADVKSPQSPPMITNLDANAIRFAAKYGWGSPTPYFDIPKWVFSGLTETTAINGIQLSCDNVTRDIRGLCAGDVNGSYVPPNGNKQANTSLQLVNHGRLEITPEITFPVRAENDMEIGAITLFLDFDASMIEITGVDMPKPGVEAPNYFVRDNVVYIGWVSLNPVRVSSGETLLLIRARLKNVNAAIIRFSLNQNPLSELADGEGNVLLGTKLAVADAQQSTTEPTARLSVYPNPVSEVLNIEYLMEKEGIFNAELVSLQGVVISKANQETSREGLNKTTLNLSVIPNGAYLLRVVFGDIQKTIKVIVNH